MSRSTQSLIKLIHESSSQLVLAVTGGGSRAISDLLSVAGASKTVLQAMVPYSAQSLAQWIGSVPEQFCSPHTARVMAMAAFEKARAQCTSPIDSPPEQSNLFGVACTAGLISDRPKQGAHRAHVAIQSADFTMTTSLELEKGHRDRLQEEQLVSFLILNQIALVSGIDTQIDLELAAQEQIVTTRTDAKPTWRMLMLGQLQVTNISGDDPRKMPASEAVVFPGAFHPLHPGHRQMADLAEKILGKPVEFELSIENVDKPSLDYTEIAQRAASFSSRQLLWLTRAATFVEKSNLFPEATFVVGADTMVRIAEARYYGNNQQACGDAISKIASGGCRFLVFGREGATGFQSLSDLKLPHELRKICQEVPEAEFRLDVSSTNLREKEEPRC